MPKREKVIKALEAHIAGVDCRSCPYAEECDYVEEMPAVLGDALELLKEQEPRVMEPEEIPDYDGAIYLEDFGEPEIAISVYDRGVAGRVKFAIRGTRSTIAGYDDYNKRWRAWTSRPTPEQMRDTPWEGESDAE